MAREMSAKMAQAKQTAREAAQAKRMKVRELAAQVAGMTEEQKAEWADRVGSVRNVEGKAYSWNNTMLLILQCGAVTLVGGYDQWRGAGRQVRAGEHGHLIMFPLTQGKLSKTETGEVVRATVDPEDMRFGWGTVFDITQTDPIDTNGDRSVSREAVNANAASGAQSDEEARSTLKLVN